MAGLGMAVLAAPGKVWAQQADDTGYRTTENKDTADLNPAPPPQDKAADAGDLKSQGPVRLARFAYVSGNVTWRATSSGDWSQATHNMPLRQGAEVMVLKGGRADLQFDDGSSLRLGNGALVSLKTLFSDAQGEFTQIVVKDGLATIYTRHKESVFEVDTPLLTVRSSGVSQVRFGVDGGSEVAVQQGSAAIEGPQGKTTVEHGNYIYATDASTAYKTLPLPAGDTWDQWNADRNKLLAGTSETYKHVPPNIGLVSEDLDSYGSWHNDPKYGWVWAPTVTTPDWRPYYLGHWVSVDPFGWTWVSDEPWGWAPYHYGTWCRLSYGWCWAPGPRHQYWSPGVVSFSSYDGVVAWAPLSPWEVRYPSFCSVGCWGGDWCFAFSIGWCGSYFPFGGGWCEGRRFDNHWVNAYHGWGVESHGGIAHGHLPGGNGGFVPFNARNAAGTTSASREAFGGTGGYRAVAHGADMFGNGRTVTAGASGAYSGPSGVRADALSRTSSRSFVTETPSGAPLSRSIYSASASASAQAARNSVYGSGASLGTRSASGVGGIGSEAARTARESVGSYGGGFSGRSASQGSFGSRTYGGSSSGSGGSGHSYRVGPSSSGGSSSGGGHSSGGGSREGGGGGHR